MKISKLFHWLYAILMLLPAFAIGVTCAYAIFNKNAYQSYYGETINEKELSQIDDITTYTGQIIYDVDTTITYSFTDGTNYFNVENFNSEISDVNNQQVAKIQMYSAVYQTDYNMWLSLRDNENNLIKNINLASTSVYFTCEIIDYSRANNNTTLGNFNNYFYKIVYNPDSYVSEVFYYSISKVEQSPLFNWAYDSFLATPITYITRLFGMPDNNIAILLMSYWLDISIIYLVFDLIMYVPLLVHRWLDKGVLE